MNTRYLAALFLTLSVAFFVGSEEIDETRPIELQVLKAYSGVWDATIEVWPEGPDSPSITFHGVETNRLFGEHWMASDFESEFMGQTMRVHGIFGYDLDQKKLVGMAVDHGPYSATYAGEYDAESKTVHWVTHVKDPTGNPLVQNTSVTQKDANERTLVLMVPGSGEEELTKFMEIVFVRRGESPDSAEGANVEEGTDVGPSN